jgi:hypothetical protein
MESYNTKKLLYAQSYIKNNQKSEILATLFTTLPKSIKQPGKLILLMAAFLIINSVNSFAQEALYYTYFPTDINKTDWKYSGHLYYQNHNNSDQLTNEFALAVNNSEYLDHDFKLKQLAKLNGSSYINRLSKGALGAWLRKEKLSFYIGMDFQQVLDGRIDEDLTKLMLMGNAPYAGQTLNFEKTDYMNVYFNRLKLGLSKTIDKTDIQHTFSGMLAFTVGQNYNYTELSSGSAFTQENGTYLDLSIAGETQMSDTVWADIFTFTGYGASLDLDYTLLKKDNFFLSLGVKNLGFINWNKAPYQATADTSIHFSGIEEDGENNIPNDFSESSLRNLIFKDVDGSSFSKTLPFHFHLSAGKFMAQSKLYVGINTYFYPSLHYNYRAELFLSWNIGDAVRISPLFAYSSFSKFNIGLAAETTLWEMLSLRAGSSYLNTTFDKESPLGQGFFLSLVFRN